MVVSTKSNAVWELDIIYMKHFDDILGVNIFPATNQKALYILTVVDVFSKKVWCRALPRNHLDAGHVLGAYRTIVRLAENSYPRTLISNNDVEFKGPWNALCREHNINHRTTNPGSPTENALCERMNRMCEAGGNDGTYKLERMARAFTNRC